ncbi:MAG: cobalamin biosynthesis protein CbiX [Verrucomicrobiota bacterium]
MAKPCTLITDNGSYRAESTFSLRRLASLLGEAVGHPVNAVSLLHSTKISPSKLDGIPAETFEPFILKKREEGIHEFLVVPMFFGPSAAIKEYLPQRVEALRSEGWEELSVRVAPCVIDELDEDDTRMARILADHVVRRRDEEKLSRPSVALVDHGAPRIKVTEVRNFLAKQMRSILPVDEFPYVEPCSMERRDGEEYAFNEPLLENLLGSEGFRGETIVSMLFASPGRHAGPGGDVAEICNEAAKETPGLRTFMTELVANHSGLIEILAERFQQGLDSEPVRWVD